MPAQVKLPGQVTMAVPQVPVQIPVPVQTPA